MTGAERQVLRARIERVILEDIKRLELERPAADRPLDQRVWQRKQVQFGRAVCFLQAALSPGTLRRAKVLLGAAVLNLC